jgi:hypothetical protein
LLGAKTDILSISPAAASVLDATIESMLSQTMSDFELIIASGGRLFRRAALEDFDVAVDQGHGGRSDAGDTRGLAEGEWPDFGQFLRDFAREAGGLGPVRPSGDGAKLRVFPRPEGQAFGKR